MEKAVLKILRIGLFVVLAIYVYAYFGETLILTGGIFVAFIGVSIILLLLFMTVNIITSYKNEPRINKILEGLENQQVVIFNNHKYKCFVSCFMIDGSKTYSATVTNKKNGETEVSIISTNSIKKIAFKISSYNWNFNTLQYE